MTMHEADDPHEREETNHDTVDELEVTEVRLQLCTAPTQPSPGIHNVTHPVKLTNVTDVVWQSSDTGSENRWYFM